MGGLTVEQFQQDQLVAVCAHNHPLGKRKRVTFKECLKYDFVGLNRGSSLPELTSRAAEQHGQTMHVRVQVRSFDAMCQLINANLGIGILPRGVVRTTTPNPLKMVELNESWAKRKLLVGVSPTCSSAAQLMLSHLRNHSTAGRT